jgi:hypothetical protein
MSEEQRQEDQEIDWNAIEIQYRANTKSVRRIADEHNISEGTIRKRAKKEGWLRDPEGVKRELVRAAMSGAGTQKGTQSGTQTDEEVRKAINTEAEQDIADMRDGLEVARRSIWKLKTLVEKAESPKDVKVIVEANKIAVETIRKIRGLDDQPTGETPVDEMLARLRNLGAELEGQ